MNQNQENLYNELISKYNFDNDQKTQIREVLENNIDVTPYLNPNINWYEMNKLREEIETNEQRTTVNL